MRRLIPSFILQNYQTGSLCGSFPAAGMFMDLSGFSAMADSQIQHGQRGAEALAAVIREVFDPLVNSVYAQGGFVASYAGDAFTALFPAKTDGPQTALRALAAAQAIQAHMQAGSTYSTPSGQYAIAVKVGLAAGEAGWQIFQTASGQQAAFCFSGPAVEASVQAERRAAPGQIICDRVFRTAVGDAVKVKPVDGYQRILSSSVSLPCMLPVDEPAIDPGLLCRFLPETILHLPDHGEFRPVVNLFVDIPSQPGQAGLQTFMQSVFRLQERYGGFFQHPAVTDKGTNMVMFWGAPVAHENDIQRALNFMRELQASLDFPVTAGVTYRMAHAGFIGAALRQDYTCYGWGVNLAARLMSSAAPGEVWLDEEIARRAGRYFEMERIGELSFRGFTQPQAVFRLGVRRERVTSGPAGRFLGREAELLQLEACLAPLLQGSFAGALLIQGDAGIGKTRLVEELQARPGFADQPVTWMTCPSNEIVRQSLNPFGYYLRDYLDISGPEETRRTRFESRVEALAGACPDASLAAELVRTASCLAALVNLTWDGSLYAQLDARGRYENTFIALASLIKIESLRRPVVLILEDAQWLDEDTRAFIPYLARSLSADRRKQYPVALLGCSRPEGSGLGLEEHDLPVASLVLGGLTRTDLAELAAQVLGRPISPPLVDLLEARAEGNPFYAEQIVRYLQEQALLEETPQGLACSSSAPVESLPTDVRSVLTARLDRLTQEVRETVQTAAVLGREFEVTLLLTMLHSDRHVRDSVRQAEQAEIWHRLSEMRYIFRHALLREAAYAMQLLERQRALHALAVEGMEHLYAADLTPHYGELAYHAEQSGLVEKARQYLELAGQSASGAFENIRGIEYYGRALALTPDPEQAKRFDLLYAREELHHRQGRKDLQLADIDLMTSIAENLEDAQKRLLAFTRRIQAEFASGEFQAVVEKSKVAASLAQASNQASILVNIYNIWCQALARLGSLEEAVLQAEAGLKLARLQNERLQEGQLQNALGLIRIEQRNPGAARVCFEQSLAIARETNDKVLEAKALNNLGHFYGTILGEYIAATDYFTRSYQIAQQMGNRMGQGLVLANLGWISGLLGDFEAARSYHLKALPVIREVGNRHHEAYTLINLSAVLGYQGEAEQALEYALMGLDLSRQVGDKSGEAWAQLYRGHAYLLLSKFDQARNAYRACARLRLKLEQPSMQMEPLAGLARAALAEGQNRPALENAEKILAHLDAGGTLEGVEEPLYVYLACYEALHASHDERAERVLGMGYRQLQDMLAAIPDETARRMYLEVRWRRALKDAWDNRAAAGV